MAANIVSRPVPSLRRRAWYRGSFLLERNVPLHLAVDDQRGEAVVGMWRSDTKLENEDIFLKRLAADGFDLASFQRLLLAMDDPDEPNDTHWIALVEEIFIVSESVPPDTGDDLDSLCASLPFAVAVRPFLQWARNQYLQAWDALLDKYHPHPFEPQLVLQQLLQPLTEQLVKRLLRVLTLELNVARLQGTLHGQTPHERFQSFVDQYLAQENDLLMFLEEYPVLVRLLVQCVSDWVNASSEAIERFCQDRGLIRAQFGPGFDEIVKVDAGISDPHRQGRTVLVFGFRSGGRLVYKPKPLAVSQHFQELLIWLNEADTVLKFPVLTVLDRGVYGWEAFVEARECDSQAQVELFYQRQGGYLALLYVLGATDFHCENIIAAGEFPYLVDLETLFHTREPDEPPRTATEHALQITNDSVLHSGLLPFFISGAEGERATDLSGLGGAEGQQSLVEIVQWTAVGTDEMRATREHGTIQDRDNRPQLDGVSVTVDRFINDLLHGFDATYRLLMERRDALSGFMERFQDDVVRYVLRPTAIYSLLLEDGYHPDFMRNGVDRDRLIDRLWVGLGVAPHLERVLPSELADLRTGDIPYFYTKPGSLHLWDSRDRCIPQFFKTNSLSKALKRCAALSDEDCEQQQEFIKAALEAGERRHLVVQPSPGGAGHEGTGLVEQGEFLEAAIAIGNRLEDLAIWGEDGQDVTWLEPQWMGQNRWQLGPTGIGLYNGLSGIAFYLAYLADATGQERFKHLSDSAIRSIEWILENSSVEPNVSAFQGRASFIYTLIHVSSLWQDERLLERAFVEAKKLEKQIRLDPFLDLLDGVAGTSIVLLLLHELTNAPLAYEAAIVCGDHLLARAQKMPVGHGWTIPLAKCPLAGLAHGGAGISWALARIGQVTKQGRFIEMALSALAYERSLFDPDQGNWLDLRTSENNYPIAWCNGASGIGIARLLCTDILPYEHFEEEIQAALATTLNQGFVGKHCLCHGVFGNMELLLLAADKRNDPRLLSEAYRIGSRTLSDARQQQRWQCGRGQSDDESVSLMAGITGIGLGLLRLATNLKVSSPLYLAAPTTPGC